MNWLLLNSGRCGSTFNMAMDEALLEAMPRFGQPVLRFYGWSEPAATFGYFQKFAEVERLTKLRPLIRRPTGGGLVPHDADWTYSLVFPAGDLYSKRYETTGDYGVICPAEPLGTWRGDLFLQPMVDAIKEWKIANGWQSVA